MFTKILTSSLLFLVAIGGYFVSIDTSLSNSEGDYIVSISAISETSAATATTPSNSDEQSKWLNEAIQGINALLGILTVIVSPAIVFAGWLMSPDWTSGDLFGLRKPMHDMWVIVSNIVYFVYAILLIIIALATIFGKENFSYKAMLPRLALGILMVPFTWWFVQWTISLATVVTASVINIPMDMITKDNKYINGNFIPKEHYITTADNKTTTSNTANNKDINCNVEPNGGDPKDCTNIQDILKQGGGTYSTLMIYAYQVFRIQDIKKIDTTKDKIEAGMQLLNGIVIGAIMFLVFGLLVIALIFMLMMRAIKLWFYAIFSPIFTLHFVAGKELFGKSTEGFDMKEFIGLCFVPAVVGLTLSFGLMIVSVIQAPKAGIAPACTNITLTSIPPKEGEGCTLIRLFGNPDNKIVKGIYTEPDGKRWMYNIIRIGGITLYFKGKATVSNKAAAAEAGSITGALDSAGGIFGTLILDIIALIFIWMAFMAAKGISKAVSAAVEPFEELGKSVGKLGASLPKYAPLPIPGGSIAGANKIAGMGQGVLEYQSNKKVEESGLGKYFKEKSGQGGSAADEVAYKESIKNGTKLSDVQNKMNKMNAESLKKEDFAKTFTENAEKTKRYIKEIPDIPTREAAQKLFDEGLKDDASRLLFTAYMSGGTVGKITTAEQAKTYLNEKYESNKKNPSSDNNNPGTTKPDASGNGTININGVPINYNGLKLDNDADAIGKKIAELINSKKGEMTKPTEEQIKKIVEDIGVESGKKSEDTIKKILDSLEKDDAFKKASS